MNMKRLRKSMPVDTCTAGFYANCHLGNCHLVGVDLTIS